MPPSSSARMVLMGFQRPYQISSIKKPRAISSGLLWSLSQPVLPRLLQTSQPATVGVPDDASKIPTRRFSGERRLAYLTANEVSNPSLESRLNKNRHFVKCNFLDKSYFIENIHYCVTLFNIRFAYSSCLMHSPTRLSKKSL